MFFANSLGPYLSPPMSVELLNHLRGKAGGQTTMSVQELRAAVADFLAKHADATSPDEAIDFLRKRGRVTTQDAKTFRIAS
jgi:hypothetical protein